MAETKNEPKKEDKDKAQAQIFAQQLMQAGYIAYLEAAHAENLDNPDKEYPTFGFKTALGVKAIAISMPVKEWLLFAEAIKKLYGE